jgi:hypothetical protein
LLKGGTSHLDMLRLGRINKTRRLMHIRTFIKTTVKEGIADVDLMNVPAVRH